MEPALASSINKALSDPGQRPNFPNHVNSGAIQSAPYHPTPSLSPGVVEALPGWKEFSAYLMPAREAFEAAHKGLAEIREAAQAAARNPAWHPHQALLRVADFAEKKRDQMAKAFDGANSRLTAAADALDASLSSPVEAAAAGSLAAEIRAHVKGLSRDERARFMAQAMEANDIKSLASILGAPAYLSGVAQEQVAYWTRQYREKNAPEATRRLAATREALHLMTRDHLIFDQVEKAMGGTFAKVAQLRSANSEAERALLLLKP